MTLNDLERVFDVKIRFRPTLCCSIYAYLELTAQIGMKIDPYYQRQKCRPMNLVSEIYADIRRGSLGRGRQTTLGVVDGYFWRFRWLRLRKLDRYGKQ